MRSRQVFLVAAYFTIILTTGALLAVPGFAESDQAAAARILGSNWRQVSRRAGIIFTGTVLSNSGESAQTDSGVPSVEIRFQVDRAIAGVEPGGILTIHEWIGSLSRHPAMRPGEHLLLFLYPPSSLGLTSPVSGSQGQIRLDPLGRTIVDQPGPVPDSQASPIDSASKLRHISAPATTLDQLERAIHAARGE